MPGGDGSLAGAPCPRLAGRQIETRPRESEGDVVNCGKWISELVECTRTESPLSPELRDHLKECAGCEQRWAGQRRLSAQFRTMRDAARAPRQPGARREQIMRECEAAHRTAFPPRLKWVLSAAA